MTCATSIAWREHRPCVRRLSSNCAAALPGARPRRTSASPASSHDHDFPCGFLSFTQGTAVAVPDPGDRQLGEAWLSMEPSPITLAAKEAGKLGKIDPDAHYLRLDHKGIDNSGTDSAPHLCSDLKLVQRLLGGDVLEQPVDQ